MKHGHTHTWYVSQYLLLTLPDAEGYSDRFTQWRCKTCLLYAEIDGNVRHLYPLKNPEFWSQADPGGPVHRTRQVRQWQRAQHERGA